MKLSEIYEKFSVAPNLGRHMRTVAKVVLFLRDHWKDDPASIDWDLVTKAALLHDLGNIVKFDLEKFPEILEKEGEDIEHWKKIQKEMIEKYGRDDHVATEKMLEELNMDERIVRTVMNKSFGRTKTIAAGEDWAVKILLYADLRVAPFGIESLNDRLEDLRKRLSHYSSRPDLPELIEAARAIEKQIQEKVAISLSEISGKSAESIAENFENIEI